MTFHDPLTILLNLFCAVCGGLVGIYFGYQFMHGKFMDDIKYGPEIRRRERERQQDRLFKSIMK